MTILLATLLATSLVAHLIHFLVFRNKFFLVRQSFIAVSDRLSRSLKSKDQESQRLKEALRTRAENELKRISETTKEVDALKVKIGYLKLKSKEASDFYNIELEKHKDTIETLQNNFASYKAEKDAKISKLKLDHFQSRKNIYVEKNAKIRDLEAKSRAIDLLQTEYQALLDVNTEQSAKIRDLEETHKEDLTVIARLLKENLTKNNLDKNSKQV